MPLIYYSDISKFDASCYKSVITSYILKTFSFLGHHIYGSNVFIIIQMLVVIHFPFLTYIFLYARNY